MGKLFLNNKQHEGNKCLFQWKVFEIVRTLVCTIKINEFPIWSSTESLGTSKINGIGTGRLQFWSKPLKFLSQRHLKRFWDKNFKGFDQNWSLPVPIPFILEVSKF